MQSSNPVLSRLGEAARSAPGAAGPTNDLGNYQLGYPTTRDRVMSLDDVVVRTVGLLALTGIVGAASWWLVPATSPLMPLAFFGSLLAGLALGLVIAFARITNPLIIGAYAVIQGLLLGVVSRRYEETYNGIVLQAVIGTFGVFLAMAALYKFRVLRATPKFARFVLGALIGVVLLSVANYVLYLFNFNLGLAEYDLTKPVGFLPILFSLVVIGVGALTFILDFDMIEQGVRHGLPEKYSWYCAFGLLVGLIFVYWEMLRLLSYLRR